MCAGELLKNVGNLEQELQKTGSTGKKLEISVVEGSFRRIAGIREFADISGTFVVRIIEILREPGKSLGFYIQQGDGWERKDGIFVSRVNLGSIVETNGLLSIGDEITKVNDIDITQMPLKDVAVIMRYVKRLFLTVKVLTSPTLVRTCSLRRPTSQVSSTGTTHNRSNVDLAPHVQPCTSTAPQVQLRAKNLQPVNLVRNTPSSKGKVTNRRVILAKDEGVLPYAYTRIGGTVRPESSATAYKTVGSAALEQPLQRGWISTESLRTLGSRHSEEIDINVIDYECIDQSLDTQQYCGQLTLNLDSIDNLIPPSDDAPLLCSILCDSELTVEVTIPASQLKGEVKIEQDYCIQLTSNRCISFNLVNGLLSSTKDILLSYFIPKPGEMQSSLKQVFALTLSPIGRLKFSLAFCPLPASIPRWANPATTKVKNSTLKELVMSNPSSSALPLIVEQTVQVIQEYGIETAGLYLVTASEREKSQAFNACLSQTLHPSQLHSLVSQVTVHAFTGVLKGFFLNLPKPLFNSDFTASLQDAVQLSEGGAQKTEISLTSFIECLPDEANATTRALLTHLRTVCQHGSMNKITIDKISQIFAPLLFTPDHSHKGECTCISSGNYRTHVKILKTLILQQK